MNHTYGLIKYVTHRIDQPVVTSVVMRRASANLYIVTKEEKCAGCKVEESGIFLCGVSYTW